MADTAAALPATGCPLTLDAALSARLRAAIHTTSGSEAGPTPQQAALHALLADPTVEALVLVIPVRGDAHASLLRLERPSDRWAQWAMLASI